MTGQLVRIEQGYSGRSTHSDRYREFVRPLLGPSESLAVFKEHLEPLNAMEVLAHVAGETE